MNKSCSSSFLLSIHDGIPPAEISKNMSSSLLEKSNDVSSKLNNDSSVNDLISVIILHIQTTILHQMIVVLIIVILILIHINLKLIVTIK